MDSDLQSLEDSFCESVETDVSIETAQNILDKYQPLIANLKDSYPSMKDLGTVTCIHIMLLVELHMYTYIIYMYVLLHVHVGIHLY